MAANICFFMQCPLLDNDDDEDGCDDDDDDDEDDEDDDDDRRRSCRWRERSAKEIIYDQI